MPLPPEEKLNAIRFRRQVPICGEFFLTLDTTPGFILACVAETVHIGKAAKLAGISIDAIRYYQKLGLVKGASRSAGGYRLFNGEQIRDLKFVRNAQELFSLTEIGELLTLRQKHQACSEVQSMLKHKLAGVREKIKTLAGLEAELTGALLNCNRELRLKRDIKHEDCCPLLTRLDRMNVSSVNKHV